MRSIGQVGRRLYSDLVTRRATVRIVSAEDASGQAERPIFIIGVYRSGTTLLRYIVDSHSRISCPPESDFLVPLFGLLDDERTIPSLGNMGFDEKHVQKRIRAFADYFFANYANAAGKPRWADKTPSYVSCLDKLHLIYPEAQFVFIYRNGLDQAHSMTRGGTFLRPVLEPFCEEGEDLRIGATKYWVQQTELMLDFENANREKVVSLRYEDLCQQPEIEVKRVFDFLGEEFEPEVLNYGNFEHTKGKEDGAAGANSSIAPAQRHVETWDRDLRRDCSAIAAKSLATLGYDNET